MNTALETGLHTRSIRELIETAKKILEEGKDYYWKFLDSDRSFVAVVIISRVTYATVLYCVALHYNPLQCCNVWFVRHCGLSAVFVFKTQFHPQV